MHLDQMNTFTSNIRGVHGFLMSAKLSANLSPAREKFLMSSSLAYVYYALGQIPQVIPNINSMLSCATKKEEPALICMKRYFSLLGAGYSKEEAFRIVSFFHQDSEVQTLLNNLNQGKNPFASYVLNCDMNCTDKCPIYHGCYQKRVNQLSDLLDSKMAELSVESFENTMQKIL
jgi:hypothetical protein